MASGERVSNPRPRAWEARALPTELPPHDPDLTLSPLPWGAVRRRALPALASLAGACLIGLLIYGVSTQSASRTLDQGVAQKRYPAAPDAAQALPSLDGRARASLASFRGRVLVLNFWASWC